MRHTITTSLYRRMAERLIRLYPVSWRERYAEEMLLIIEDVPPTFKTVGNLLINLCDAYTHQHLVNGRTTHMLQRMRSSELNMYGSTLIFFVAWFIVQFRITDPGQGRYLLEGFSYRSSSLLVNIIHTVSYLLLLSLLLGGLPILLAAGWKTLQTRNLRAPLFFLFLGLISPFVVALLAFILALGMAFTWVSLLSIFIGLCMSLALIFFAVGHVAPSRRVTHYVLSLATLIPVIMLVGLVALPFGIVPSFIDALMTGDGIAYIIRDSSLILIMLLALCFSLISLKNGFEAKQMAEVNA